MADPFAQFKAERQLALFGLPLVAIYHSHPGGGTQLSPLDVIFARKRARLQIVVALERTDFPGKEMRAYRIVENTPVEIEVRIYDED